MKYQELSWKWLSFSHLHKIKRKGHFYPTHERDRGNRVLASQKEEHLDKTPCAEMLPSSEAISPVQGDVENSTEAYFLQKINSNFYITKFYLGKYLSHLIDFSCL